jgi:hypothetical protein
MKTDVNTYSNQLLMALRTRDVPGPRIAEALAEVHSHVTETGEDPQDAFGPPQAYADEVSAALGGPAPSPFWRDVLSARTLAYFVAGAGGSGLLVNGVIASSVGQPGPLGLSGLVAVLLGVAVLGGLAVALALLARRRDDQVLDPRTGADMSPPTPRWLLPLMILPPLLGIAMAVVFAVAHR